MRTLAPTTDEEVAKAAWLAKNTEPAAASAPKPVATRMAASLAAHGGNDHNFNMRGYVVTRDVGPDMTCAWATETTPKPKHAKQAKPIPAIAPAASVAPKPAAEPAATYFGNDHNFNMRGYVVTRDVGSDMTCAWATETTPKPKHAKQAKPIPAIASAASVAPKPAAEPAATYFGNDHNFNMRGYVATRDVGPDMTCAWATETAPKPKLTKPISGAPPASPDMTCAWATETQRGRRHGPSKPGDCWKGPTY